MPAAATNGKPNVWTVERAVEAIRQHQRKHGVLPILRDTVNNPDLPGAGTIRSTLKMTWADLVEAAGFDRPRRGGVSDRKRSGRAAATTAARPATPPAEDPPTVVLDRHPTGAGDQVEARPDEPLAPGIPGNPGAPIEVAKQEVALSEPGVAEEANGVGRTPPDAPVGRDTDEGQTDLASRSLDVPGSPSAAPEPARDYAAEALRETPAAIDLLAETVE